MAVLHGNLSLSLPTPLAITTCHYHLPLPQTCHSAVEEGVAVLHGNRRAFLNDKQPAFKVRRRFYNESKVDVDDGPLLKVMIKEIKIEMMIMMIDLVMMRITDGTGGRKLFRGAALQPIQSPF